MVKTSLELLCGVLFRFGLVALWFWVTLNLVVFYFGCSIGCIVTAC